MSEGLSKSNLLKIKAKIKTYNGFLPALNMRKQQISMRLAGVEAELRELEIKTQQLFMLIIEQLPMIASSKLELSSWLAIESITTKKVNVVGVEIPEFVSVEMNNNLCETAIMPFWGYCYIEKIEDYLNLFAKVKILNQQKTILKEAQLKVTQKINLFEKVLLPKNYEKAKKIKIFLDDNERATIVSCKIVKRKGQQE